MSSDGPKFFDALEFARTTNKDVASILSNPANTEQTNIFKTANAGIISSVDRIPEAKWNEDEDLDIEDDIR